MRTTGLLLLAAVAAIGGTYSLPAKADVTYTYTGNPFTFAQPPITTSDFVSAVLTFAAALPANMPLSPVSTVSFVFEDGYAGDTITEANSAQSGINVGTDASGAIDTWQVGAVSFSGLSIQTSDALSGPVFVVTDDVDLPSLQIGAFVTDAPGTWSATQVSSMPEPPAWTLSLLAVLSLGWLRFRRYRHLG